MQFTESIFLFYFLPLSLLIHRATLARSANGQSYPVVARATLFLLTLFFYGFRQPWWLVPFLFSIGFDFVWVWCLTRVESPIGRKIIVTCSVTQNLGLLALFKYSDHAISLLAKIDPRAASWIPVLHLGNESTALPAGISFYTFESLSFVIDVYRREIAAPKSAMEFFGFIGMFPRFVAGPIVRYKDMVAQFARYRGMDLEKGLYLFALGLFLKCGFADQFAVFVNYAFKRSGQPEMLAAWIGVFSFTMQIYFDFSGYSLMAQGLGRCFGFEFPANFRRPYLAQGFSDFWKRWHISLSQWLRDYVYIPLGGNRCGPFRNYFNLFITMVLGGIWHGSLGTFVIWGAWHGLLLVLEKAKLLPRWKPLTFLLVLMAWVPFRASSYAEMKLVWRGLVSPTAGFFPHNWDLLTYNAFSLTLAILGTLYCFHFEAKWNLEELDGRELVWKDRAAAIALSTLAVLFALSDPGIPFLYFQF